MPDWFLTLEACLVLQVPPWELDHQGRSKLFWQEAALTKVGCERWAEREAHLAASRDMERRRRTWR